MFFGLWEVYPAARCINFTLRVYKDICLHNGNKYHLQPLDGTTVQGLVSDRSFHRVFHADDDEISQERMLKAYGGPPTGMDTYVAQGTHGWCVSFAMRGGSSAEFRKKLIAYLATQTLAPL